MTLPSPAEEVKNTKDFGFLPIPKRLQYDPERPFHFGTVLIISFGFTSTFAMANLYYHQPIMVELSVVFNVSYSKISILPTLVQAGYATGILLISPLGDLIRRRQLKLTLVAIATCLTIGLSIARSLLVFQILTYFVGVFSVTSQVLLPLTADLAPPSRRGFALSIVFSGLLFGILVARLLSGIIAQFASWRIVYYMAIGIQCFIIVMLYLLVPDYPARNRDLTYFQILWSMLRFSVTEPVLIQASLCCMASAASFSAFWATLTFLLSGDPYNYSTLVIGLFGLIGILGVSMGPLLGRMIDYLVPWHASLLACMGLLVFQIVQVVGNGLNISAVVLAIFGMDAFRQMLQTSLATNIFSIAPEARARLNAMYIFTIFVGQVMGSSVGTKVFLEYGWRASAAVTLGFAGWQIFILLLRGPHCRRYTWFGYEGGLQARRNRVVSNSEQPRRTSAPNFGGEGVHNLTPDIRVERVGEGLQVDTEK